MAHKPGHYGTSSNLGSQLNNFNNISWAGGVDTPYNSNNYNTSYNMADSIRKEVVPGLNQNAGWLSNDWGNNWELAKGAGKDLWTGLGKGTDKLFTAGGMEGLGSVLEGAGNLARGWAAMKNLKLTRQAMENQQNQWQTNFDAQALAANNAISNQNAWKQAQGRTDFGSYVGGKPAGTQYVG